MVRTGVAADEQNAGCSFVIRVRIARGSATELLEHRFHAGGVTEPGAVIDVVGAHHQAHELLLHEGVFVRRFGGGEAAEVAAELAETRGYEVQGIIPGGPAELPVAPNERCG